MIQEMERLMRIAVLEIQQAGELAGSHLTEEEIRKHLENKLLEDKQGITNRHTVVVTRCAAPDFEECAGCIHRDEDYDEDWFPNGKNNCIKRMYVVGDECSASIVCDCYERVEEENE